MSSKKDEPKIVTGGITVYRKYEVKEEELEVLENGYTNKNLNWAHSLLSISVSFFLAVITANFDDFYEKEVVFIIACITLIEGLLCWFRSRSSEKKQKKVFKIIRGRINDRIPQAATNRDTQDEIIDGE
jgi:hypothetical protein